MIEETQAEINARLTAGVAANTSSIVSENLRATTAENRIKMCVKYMGKKATPELLPASGNTNGDFWYVESNRYGYFWNGTQWENVGEITKGIDGFSPTANVATSGSVVTITITDKNGTTTATVSSASANVTKTTVDQTGNKTTAITCQTGNGTPTTATINCPDIKIVASSESATEAGTIYFVTGS